MEPTFVHLHNHTEYSILDGCLKVGALVQAAYDHKMPAVAMTDHGNVFGAVQFFKAAKARGIKPILGCEVYVAPQSRFDKKPGGPEETHHFHLVLLVKDDRGYRNLCRLLTSAYLEGFYYRPRIDKELLAAHSEGLIGLSACLKGEIATWLGRGCPEKAEETARGYAGLFAPGDFYIELMDHGLPDQKAVNPQLVAVARKLDLPLVATNDIHFARREDAESQDVLVCVQTNRKISDPDRIKFSTDQFYFKSAAEMAELFRDTPDAIENTGKIAARCGFEFPSKTYHLPVFAPPGGKDLSDYFEEVAWTGFRTRMAQREAEGWNGGDGHTRAEYEQRMEREIALIKKMGFEGYFLIVWDLLRAAREKGIPVGPGRGSAAGSLLAYALEITEIDPIEYDLLFERFLNPERISLPDIDMDFCGRRRQEMIEYVTQKYGQDNVCQIITFGTMAARGAIRDVGRVLEVPLPEVDRVAKMIPFAVDATIADALKSVPELKALRDRNSKIAQLLAIAQKIEGQVRHPSIHAAGIVITPHPLVEYLPLYQSVKGEITTQYPMGDVENLGLLKMDLLGLRNLTVIDDALALVNAETGRTIDINGLPLDDPKTFALFQSGNTDGVFQFESPGMKDLLRRFRPTEFRDLIALNALYRPGPLKSGMTDESIHRRNHPERIAYEVPELEPILRETRGIIIYQEQVMRIATDLAGFTLAGADLLRKAMGKKDKVTMKAQKQKFLQGAKKKGIAASKADKIFEQIKEFAEYGFNKSHSAAYAFLAYQTAYLKAHYPVHFLAALLTSEAERGATPQVVKYIGECHEMGIEVLPPDINRSEFRFTVEDGRIRFGLAAVKGIGQAAVEELVAARGKAGGFKSPFDLFLEHDTKVLNRKAVESLIKAGAFDSLGWKRSQCFHMLDRMIDFGHEVQKAQAARQGSLFGSDTAVPPDMPPEVQDMREWDESHVLSYEMDALGLYVTGHPLTRHKDRLRKLVSHLVEELDAGRDFDKDVRLAGVIGSYKALKTRKDERMATFVLEDLSGKIEVVAFPDAFSKCGPYLREGQLVCIRGKYMGEEDNRRISLSQAMPLAEAFEKQAKRLVVRIFLPGLEEATLSELKSILDGHEGRCPVEFELVTPHSYRLVAQSAEVQKVTPSEELLEKIEDLLGENSVSV
ncbi:MAG: DNA polymerase III subunit alpha, partial [Candidatus Aminicenantes bacterium]|nr:DNA polymerase III subunit alpha [Candidatus Aminicenantes bacterium]